MSVTAKAIAQGTMRMVHDAFAWNYARQGDAQRIALAAGLGLIPRDRITGAVTLDEATQAMLTRPFPGTQPPSTDSTFVVSGSGQPATPDKPATSPAPVATPTETQAAPVAAAPAGPAPVAAGVSKWIGPLLVGAGLTGGAAGLAYWLKQPPTTPTATPEIRWQLDSSNEEVKP